MECCPLVEGLKKEFTDGIVFKNNVISCNRKSLETWFKQFGLKLKIEQNGETKEETISVWQDINANQDLGQIKNAIDNLVSSIH